MKRLIGASLFAIGFSISPLFPGAVSISDKLNRAAYQSQIEIVTNEVKPTGNSKGAIFEQDLEISGDDLYPAMILVDGKGNIYTYSAGQLIKYDLSGKEVLRKKLRQGQGPEEFQMPEFAMSGDDHIYIADPPQRRLTILDSGFQLSKIMKLNFYGGVLELDSKNCLCFLSLKMLPDTTDRQNLTLSKYTPAGKLLWQGFSYPWGITRDSKGIGHHAVFHPQLKYKIDHTDNFYYAMTNKYEITINDPRGVIKKTISKKGSSRSITEKEIKKYQPKSSGPGLVFDLPDHMPFIADIFVLENSWLLVVTFENDDEENSLAGDLFDEKGIYRSRISVPKYFNWYTQARPNKSFAVYKNGFFFTVETDKDEERFFIKRYKLRWL